MKISLEFYSYNAYDEREVTEITIKKDDKYYEILKNNISLISLSSEELQQFINALNAIQQI